MSSDSSSNEEYNVEKILDVKTKGNKTKYFVKWEGYSSDSNTWEPEENLSNCHKLLEDFKKERERLKANKNRNHNSHKSSKSSRLNGSSVTPNSMERKRKSGNDIKKKSTDSDPTTPNKRKQDKSEFKKKLNFDSKNNTPQKENISELKEKKSSNKKTTEYSREMLLSMFPENANGFASGYTAVSIDGATIRDGEYYLLVSFEELDKPQFIRNTIVNEEVPKLVIRYYEERVCFD